MSSESVVVGNVLILVTIYRYLFSIYQPATFSQTLLEYIHTLNKSVVTTQAQSRRWIWFILCELKQKRSRSTWHCFPKSEPISHCENDVVDPSESIGFSAHAGPCRIHRCIWLQVWQCPIRKEYRPDWGCANTLHHVSDGLQWPYGVWAATRCPCVRTFCLLPLYTFFHNKCLFLQSSS